jgi:transposase
MRKRLEAAHTKLAASRAFMRTAYFSQAHEMLFDAHARALAAFGGVPRRGICDNMKTAVDKVRQCKSRTVNARVEAMTGHYLFEPEFYNRAADWEKGIGEKNVQDRRRGIWVEAAERSWPDQASLNAWLHQTCLDA